MTYGWNLEMQVRVARRGKRVLELPVDNRERIGGASKVAGTFSGSLRAGARKFLPLSGACCLFASGGTLHSGKVRS